MSTTAAPALPAADTPALPALAERRGRAMGSDLHLLATGVDELLPELLDRAEALLVDLEARWSRFRPDSEISRLNADASGAPFPVSAATAHLVRRAIEGYRLTDGLFDPTMLRALIAAGYDRPFDELPAVVTVPDLPGTTPLGRAEGDCSEIVVADNTVTLPAGLAIDPGGIGKGLAADIVVEALLAWGADGALVNVGGDLRCAGTGPAGADAGWVVALPGTPADGPAVIQLAAGGIATSGCLRRRWATATAAAATGRSDDGPAADVGTGHHLLEPLTGRPSPTAAPSVTVVAATAWEAEVLGTAVAARGSLPVDRSMLGDALVVLTDVNGRRRSHGPLDRFVR